MRVFAAAAARRWEEPLGGAVLLPVALQLPVYRLGQRDPALLAALAVARDHRAGCSGSLRARSRRRFAPRNDVVDRQAARLLQAQPARSILLWVLSFVEGQQ